MDYSELGIIEESILPGFSEGRMNSFLEWLNRDDYFGKKVHWDENYNDFIKKYNGAKLKKCGISTRRNPGDCITNFLHFTPMTNGDPRWASRVTASHELTEDRLGYRLMPFAGLIAGDMVCFDYGIMDENNRPAVVVWLHEYADEDLPVEEYTDYVASNFDEFLKVLYYPDPDYPV